MTTPHEEQNRLAKILGIDKLYFKREDLHPYGSHKGRSIPVMIDHYRKGGDGHFVISSSGNAALAAALHIKSINNDSGSNTDNPVILDIFVGNRIALSKLEKLNVLASENIRVSVKDRPLQALNEAVNGGKRSLRQSTDDTALIGYESLARELVEISGIGAVFIGTSSGTTAQALAQYFTGNGLDIQVHIVQTPSCHPMLDGFGDFETVNEVSAADAIVDKTAHRKNILLPLIGKTGGRGWLATNDDIRSAQELVKTHAGLAVSANSALSVVGAIQSARTKFDIKGAVVCLICGE